MANSQDAYYLSLLALAEYFRTQTPANIKTCVQCLKAVLTFEPPPKVEARTHLQLGLLLTQYTNNVQLATDHLEQAWNLSMSKAGFDDVRFEAATELASLYEIMSSVGKAKTLLKQGLDLSHQSPYWHCRIIFQIARIAKSERDYGTACSILQSGIEYAHIQGITYTQILFMLSKVMVLLLENRGSADVQPLFNQTSQMIEQFNGDIQQKEHLRVFFLVLWVCYNLYNGQVKSVRASLKQLQQSVTASQESAAEYDVNSSPRSEQFMWISKNYLCILVYLISVMHSVQAGHMDKAQKYTEKALTQIQKLKGNKCSPVLTAMELLLLEHSTMCYLVKGAKVSALGEISKVATLLHSNPLLMQSHKGQMHALLAVYAMSMNNPEACEMQFKAALKASPNSDLWVFANLNLAFVYLRCHREKDFQALMEKINPETLATQSYSLKATAYYVQGLYSFFSNHLDDGKRYLRESLKMANSEDLNRLTSCSLLLLGHIFLALGSPKEASGMVTPAMQLASKIPDLHLQLWASAIFRDLYRQLGDTAQEKESHQNHCFFSQTLLSDHLAASKLPQHRLLVWTEGPLPLIPV